MVIVIDGLDSSEIKQVLKCLPIRSIRQPILDNNKLAKKYIVGYRPGNVTYLQLFPMYSSEIRLRNKEIIHTLKSVIRQFFDEKGIIELIDQLRADSDWTGCANFAIQLGNCNCEMSFELICKICGLDISEDKRTFITSLLEKITEVKRKQCEERDDINCRIQNLTSESERLKKEIESLQKKFQLVKSEKDDLITKLAEKNQKLIESEALLNKTSVELEETKTLREKADRYSVECEATISKLNSDIQELNEKMKKLSQEKNDYAKAVEIAEKHNQFEYDEIIKRLVSDTINDIKDDYEIDQEQFESIVGSTEDSDTILTVWENLSRINAEIVADIETAMRSKKIDISIVDRCNDVENNILVKYVIVKAIKSIYYEFMSRAEKDKKLGDPQK